jgi:hypothetical protein
MALPRPVSPLAAWRDLRRFLAARQKHELIFGILAILMTGTFIVAFFVDSNIERPWKRDIQYVESWPLDRSDEEIRAQQLIDAEKRAVQEAEMAKLRAERQEQFKKIDDRLNRLGL